VSDPEEERVENIARALSESEEPKAPKRARLEDPEPAFITPLPEPSDENAVEESVENIMKEVAASKPERVKNFGFSKPIRY